MVIDPLSLVNLLKNIVYLCARRFRLRSARMRREWVSSLSLRRPVKNPSVVHEAQQGGIHQREMDERRKFQFRWIRLSSISTRLTSFVPLAVTKNQFKAARLLLKSGANVNAPGPEGQTPLVDAVLNNNTKVRWSIRSCIVESCIVG